MIDNDLEKDKNIPSEREPVDIGLSNKKLGELSETFQDIEDNIFKFDPVEIENIKHYITQIKSKIPLADFEAKLNNTYIWLAELRERYNSTKDNKIKEEYLNKINKIIDLLIKVKECYIGEDIITEFDKKRIALTVDKYLEQFNERKERDNIYFLANRIKNGDQRYFSDFREKVKKSIDQEQLKLIYEYIKGELDFEEKKPSYQLSKIEKEKMETINSGYAIVESRIQFLNEKNK